MKKLVLMFVAIAAVSFASCGNKAADAEKKQLQILSVSLTLSQQ